MDKKTLDQIERYSLGILVAEFVAKKTSALAGGYEVSFAGHCQPCGSWIPHAPHAIKEYTNVHGDTNVYFCPGKDGDGIEIIETYRTASSPSCAATFAAKVIIND